MKIEIPIEVVDMGKDAAWLYLYLARAKVRGDTLPGQRDIASTFGIGRQVVRSMMERVEKYANNPPITHQQPTNNPPITHTYTENERVKGGRQPTNNPDTPSFTSPTTPSTTNLPSFNKEKQLSKDSGKKKEATPQAPSNIERKQEAFYQELIPYVEGQEPVKNSRGETYKQYPPDMVRDFFDHWSAELQHKKGVMLKETEKTFVISRRLATWKNIASRNGSQGMTVGVNLQNSENKEYDGW